MLKPCEQLRVTVCIAETLALLDGIGEVSRGSSSPFRFVVAVLARGWVGKMSWQALIVESVICSDY
jgi:hypothetical protein